MKYPNIQKNIGAVVATLVLVFILFAGSTSLAAPGDLTVIPLNAGKAAQGMREFHIGNSGLSGTGLDVSEEGSESLFAEPGNIMAIFGNLLVNGETYIGQPGRFDYGTVTAPPNALNIDGTFLSSELSHSSGAAQEKLCVDELGNIDICS